VLSTAFGAPARPSRQPPAESRTSRALRRVDRDVQTEGDSTVTIAELLPPETVEKLRKLQEQLSSKASK
jgi:hypothetical protein